jgi:hypothetical protein
VSKKEPKSLKHEAEKIESEHRKAIEELTIAIEELVSGRKKPKDLEGIISVARELAQNWKIKEPSGKKRPLFGSIERNTTVLLAGLVVALRRDHEFLERIRRYFANELEKLNRESRYADDVAALLAWGQAHPKPKREGKPTKEDKRSRWHRSFYNSIEYQFGGGLEAEFRKRLPFLALGPYDPTYQPVCLDKIFAGGAVNMRTLEDLFFGIGRKRLGKLLRGEKKKRRYDFADVIQIMGELLKARPRKKRKGSKPGPARGIWLNDMDLRERVLKGIEARQNSFLVREDIKSAFTLSYTMTCKALGKDRPKTGS